MKSKFNVGDIVRVSSPALSFYNEVVKVVKLHNDRYETCDIQFLNSTPIYQQFSIFRELSSDSLEPDKASIINKILSEI